MKLHSDAWRNISFMMIGATAVFGGFAALTPSDHDDGDHGIAGHLAGAFVSQAHAGEAGELGLGREALPEEIAAWDIDIRPDGAGLPQGAGTVADGEAVFAEKCASCHGDFGEAVGRWPVLAGGFETLNSEDPVKTVGSYWPYLSTVWDYVHRAMPFGDAQSLTDDEVYAITAYLLYVNDLVDDEEFELSNANFLETPLPNEANFFLDDRLETEKAFWNRADICMQNCKESVEITSKARVLQVTPGDGAGGGGEEEAATSAEAEVQEASAQIETAVVELDPEQVKAGKKVFRKCKACHQVGDGAKHRTGPMLNGVFGRSAGTADGFKKYSDAMTTAGADGLVWDDATMSEFLAKPKKYVDGTSMAFAGLKKEADIAAVIAYLRSESGE
ncbi:MAG: c-type cytochrome [Pseudomonadota bacterium]